jgi:hypothetical protein
MSRLIKEFKVENLSDYSFCEAGVNSPVFFSHKYDLEDVCGKVVHISKRREVVNIEFSKYHPIFDVLKNIDLKVALDLVHYKVFPCHPKTVTEFVVYMSHGKD